MQEVLLLLVRIGCALGRSQCTGWSAFWCRTRTNKFMGQQHGQHLRSPPRALYVA